ncbi:MAG: hypothetical protein QXO84_00840 [Candidatus Aenigmatarchaeota archaeon]
MDLKGFFKLEKNKIILTLVILLIFPLPYWNGILCERCEKEPCPKCPDTNFGPALLGWWFTWKGSFYGHSKIIGNYHLALNVLEKILLQLLIIGLPVSYLISCFIFWFFKNR